MTKPIIVHNKPRRPGPKPPIVGHPAMRDRPYEDDEAELLIAVEAWKAATGRKFAGVTDVLRVAKGLGYRKAEEGGP